MGCKAGGGDEGGGCGWVNGTEVLVQGLGDWDVGCLARRPGAEGACYGWDSDQLATILVRRLGSSLVVTAWERSGRK